MAASDNLHPQQLAMFMPAKKIVETYALGDVDKAAWNQTAGDKMGTLRRKQNDNVTQSNEYNGPRDFDNGGIQKPIVLDHRERFIKGMGRIGQHEVADGHHRLAHALFKDPNTEVPVQHTDTWTTRTMDDYHNMAESKARRQRAIISIPKGAY